MRFVVIGILVVLGCLGGCTNSPPPMSCTGTGGGASFCVDFIAGFTPVTAAQFCSMGSFSQTSACPSNARVGRCTETLTNVGGTATFVLNVYAPATTAQAQTQCPPPMPTANVTYSFQAN